MSQTPIKFWMPIEFAKGGKGKDKKAQMRIRGVASSPELDSDGEILEPSGFDTSYFLKKGVFNWHHQTKHSPKAIIGEPTNATIKNNQMLVEGYLYPDSDVAREVYELAEILQNNSPNRRLGLSIEGKAVERDPNNNKRITKAVITGCAITHMPKNPATLMEVVKGETDGMDMEYDELDVDKILVKAENTTKKSQVEGEEGEEEEEDEDEVEKTLNTGNASAILPESLDGKVKELSKAQIFEMLFDRMPDLGVDQATQFLPIIYKTASKMNANDITPEVIEKSLQILELAGDNSNARSTEHIEKGGDVEKCTYEKAKNGDYFMKMINGERADDKKYTKDGDEYKAINKGGSDAPYVEEDDFETFDKGEGEEPLEAGNEPGEDFIDLEERFDAVEKGIENTLTNSNHYAKATGIVIRGLYDRIGNLESQLTKAIETIENFGSQPQSRRKSLARNAQPIEKGGFGPNTGATVLHVTQNRGQILSKLEELTFAKGELNESLGNAMAVFESSSILNPVAQQALAANNIQVVAD